jgi:hypothetical protein
VAVVALAHAEQDRDDQTDMTAEELKALLTRRYPGGVFVGMPGAWTCVEEYRGIDLLAWSAWSSKSRYARIGHEVKVSRADLRAELLRPSKRALNVAWCHEFYFAVPKGMLTDDELAYEEPEWQPEDWMGERCPGFNGQACSPRWGRKTHSVRVPVPATPSYASSIWDEGWAFIPCPTCKGKGVTTLSRVERETPKCWVPRDVGLIMVAEHGSETVRKSPRRHVVPVLTDRELGQLIRWVSMRPDKRHVNGSRPVAEVPLA